MRTWDEKTYRMTAKHLRRSLTWAKGHPHGDLLKCQTRVLANHFAHTFSMDNPKFDSIKFYKAIFGEER